jgi:hypothetical protein
MVNPSRPPLPPNKAYHRPLNYLEYVKDFDPYAHVRVFKVTIKINNETNDAETVNLFSSILRDVVFGLGFNYMGDYPNHTFAELQLTFCKKYIKV